jgi:hypothetical protein
MAAEEAKWRKQNINKKTKMSLCVFFMVRSFITLKFQYVKKILSVYKLSLSISVEAGDIINLAVHIIKYDVSLIAIRILGNQLGQQGPLSKSDK